MTNFESLSKYSKITFISQNVGILIASIGIPLNIVTFIIFSRRRFDSYAFSFYMRVSCVTDTIVLAHTFRHWANYVLDANVDIVADFFCKLCEYGLLYVNGSVSVWLLGMIALDRLVTIAFPFKFAFFKKRWFQISTIVGIYLFSLCLYVSVPIMSVLEVDYDANNESNSSEVVRSCVIVRNGEDIVYWINMANLVLVTFFINNILTGIMIVYIFRLSRKKFLAKDRQNRRMARDRKFAINSITLNILCLASKSPFLIASLLTTYLHLEEDETEMMITIGETIFLIDNASSFFANLVVNSMFYEEFCKMLGLKENFSDALRSIYTQDQSKV